jgi:hypothetical protein
MTFICSAEQSGGAQSVHKGGSNRRRLHVLPAHMSFRLSYKNFFKQTKMTVRLTHYFCKKLMVIAVLLLMFINACVRILLRRMAKQILVIKSFLLQGSFPLGKMPYYSYLLLPMSYLQTKITKLWQS